MNFTTITVSALNITELQKQFLISIGFGITGSNLSKSIKSDEAYIILGQLGAKLIPFNLQTSSPNYASKPCTTCKK